MSFDDVYFDIKNIGNTNNILTPPSTQIIIQC